MVLYFFLSGYVLEFMKKRNLKINDDWKTPQDLYNSLDKEFHFDFDPCPFKHDIDELPIPLFSSKLQEISNNVQTF